MKKALILGRFQPFHFGHLNVINEVIKEGLLPIIGIGSSQEGNTELKHTSLFKASKLRVGT